VSIAVADVDERSSLNLTVRLSNVPYLLPVPALLLLLLLCVGDSVVQLLAKVFSFGDGSDVIMIALALYAAAMRGLLQPIYVFSN
jgi:hypothetical protein